MVKMSDGELCLLCQANNKRSFLHSYQLNLDEAIVLCENPQCSYPVGSTNFCVTYSRSFNHIDVPKPRDVGPSVPEAQVALQTRMAGYARNNGKAFRSVIGTQTDQRSNSRGFTKTQRFTRIQPGMGGNNGPLTNGNPFTSSNHSNSVLKLNGLSNGTHSINGHGNHASNSADRISPTSSNNSSDVKAFEEFKFSTKDGQPRQVSKSEPPIKLNKITVNGAINSNTNDIKSHQNGEAVKGVVKGRSSSCSKGSTSSAKERTAVIKQAKTFFSYPKKFIQWRNKEALCWLDAVQCLLVHNRHVQQIVFSDNFNQDSVVYKLVKAQKQAQELLETIKAENVSVLFSSKNRHSEIHPACSSQDGGKVEMLVSQDGSLDVQTGAGNQTSGQSLSGNTEISDSLKASKIEDEMSSIREKVWRALQPKLQFERGRDDSPVFTMSSLIRENPNIEKLFKLNYTFWVQCSKCGYAEQEVFEKVLPTLPAVVKDFQITEPSHVKYCALCGFNEARRTMVYDQLSDCLLLHFTEGLPHNHWRKLDFDHQGYLYTVTGVVQYLNNPDHFIAWLRDPTGSKWLRCDDLQSPVCTFQSQAAVPPSQIHIVMWEKVPIPLKSNQTKSNQIHSGQNPVKMQNLATGTTEIPSLKVNGGIQQNGSDSNLVVNAFNALKVNRTAQNVNVIKMDVNESNQVFPASGKTSVGTMLSEIPSGRFNVPKQTGSQCSSLSSACSELSEDLPEFAAFLPTVSVVRPVPCHTSVSNNSTSVSNTSGGISLNSNISKNSNTKSEVSSSTCNMVNSAQGVVNNSDEINTETNQTDVVGHVGQASGTSEPMTFSSFTFSGQKSNIQPSAVFCAPKPCEKKASQKAPVTYPPFSVQKTTNPSDTKTDRTVSNSYSVIATEVDNSHIKESDKQNTANNLDPFVVPKSIDDKQSKKTDKNRFTPAHKMDKRRSLFTYMKRNRPNAVLNRKDMFMTLDMVEDKAKSQPATPANFVPINQLTGDGNVSYLGKVQQYLMNNKVGFDNAKFDGMMLKSRSETAIDRMIIGRDRKNSIGDSASSCNSRVVSPMSEWFGRKVHSPTRSVYSTANVSAVKRKSLTDAVQVVRQGKKARSEAVIVNGQGDSKIASVNVQNGPLNRKIVIVKGQTNGNHAVGKVVEANGNINKSYPTTKIHEIDNNVHQAPAINGHNEPLKKGDNAGGPDTTDCVLQDLYEALNIPYQDVSSTMASVMSDVDDILDFMRPSELTTGFSETVSTTLPVQPTRQISGQIASSNG